VNSGCSLSECQHQIHNETTILVIFLAVTLPPYIRTMPVRALGETASRAPQEINLECAAERRHYVFFVGEEGGPRFWRVPSNLVLLHTTDDYEDFLEKKAYLLSRRRLRWNLPSKLTMPKKRPFLPEVSGGWLCQRDVKLSGTFSSSDSPRTSRPWSSCSSRRCDCQFVGSRSRRSTSSDDEGDKGPMGGASNICCKRPSR
jgi:hypothetical protein